MLYFLNILYLNCCFKRLDLPIKKHFIYVVSPYESDAQITFLLENKLADFAITEDSDLYTCGCQAVSFVEIKYKAGESCGRAPGQASDYALQAPNPLDSSTMTRCFIRISSPPNQSGPQVFCPPASPLAGLD